MVGLVAFRIYELYYFDAITYYKITWFITNKSDVWKLDEQIIQLFF